MDNGTTPNLNQLPMGTVLGDFRITGVIGEGGFGIVYRAHELSLERTVAIKEYLPAAIAGRTGDRSVQVRSKLNHAVFVSGLKNFMREAQMLARFSHPAMVEVHRVWEQNGTAYMAMRYYAGRTLRETRQGTNTLDTAQIRRILEPVCDALQLLHAENVIHRDVSPDNILMRENGAPVLLDLGAARLVIGGMTQALTTVLKPGYAPIEQYVDDGTMPQGPWTDIYGLGAVLYYLLTGTPPPQAVARMINDPLQAIATRLAANVPEYLLGPTIKALALRPENRFQRVEELREALGWTTPLDPELRTAGFLNVPFMSTPGAAPATIALAPVAARTSRADPPVSSPGVPATEPTLPTSPPESPPSTGNLDPTVLWTGPPITLQTLQTLQSSSLAVSTSTPPGPPPVAAPAETSAQTAADSAVSRVTTTATATTATATTATSTVATPTSGLRSARTTTTVASAPRALDAAAPSRRKLRWLAAGVAATLGLAALYLTLNRKPDASTAPAVAAGTSETSATNTAPSLSVSSNITVDPARPGVDLVAQASAGKADSAATEKAARDKAGAADRPRKADAPNRSGDDKTAERASRKSKESAAPPRQIEELSAQAIAAFKRGELATARTLWSLILSHPDVSAHDKAVAYNNMAVSYCQHDDQANCERMYAAMLRADRSYKVDAQEREHRLYKRAYDRALRSLPRD